MNAPTPAKLREGCTVATQEGSVQRQMPSMDQAGTRKILLGASAYYPSTHYVNATSSKRWQLTYQMSSTRASYGKSPDFSFYRLLPL
jgi:hypothetical protein